MEGFVPVCVWTGFGFGFGFGGVRSNFFLRGGGKGGMVVCGSDFGGFFFGGEISVDGWMGVWDWDVDTGMGMGVGMDMGVFEDVYSCFNCLLVNFQVRLSEDG